MNSFHRVLSVIAVLCIYMAGYKVGSVDPTPLIGAQGFFLNAAIFLLFGVMIGLCMSLILMEKMYVYKRYSGTKRFYFLPYGEEYSESVFFCDVTEHEENEISKEGVIPEDIIPLERIKSFS